MKMSIKQSCETLEKPTIQLQIGRNMQRYIREYCTKFAGKWVWSILLLLLAVPVGYAQESNVLFQFTARDCQFGDTTRYVIDCGTIAMPLNHDTPDNGEIIQLAVAIIHTPNPNPEPDPIVYLEGGPGGSDVQFAPIMPIRNPFLQVVLQSRDVILVDQRSMGLSQPQLFCSPFRTPMDAFASDFTETFVQRMKDCPAQFAEQGIDWTQFNNEQNARDLSEIGRSLGYKQVNLYGISYGTLLGLIILRDNPQSIRSVILDSVLTPDAKTFEETAQAMSNEFDDILADCDADLICRLAYPNLRETFVATYERLSTQADTYSYEGQSIIISAGFFAERIRSMMATTADIGRVPMMSTAFANQDYDVVRPFIQEVMNTRTENLPNQALFVTMVCPQGVANSGVDEMINAQANYEMPFRVAGFNTDSYIRCAVWGDPLPTDQTMPISDIPTLLLAGESDPITPLVWAERALQGLSSGILIKVPHTSHVTLGQECARQIASVFLESPDKQPDTSCLSGIPAPQFTLHGTVTRQPLQVLTAILGILLVINIMRSAGMLRQYGRWIAWRSAFRRLGWMPLISLLVLCLLALSNVHLLPDDLVEIGIVQSIVPLMMALQASAVFASDDEPALEIQLSAPRPIVFVLLERLVAIVISYSMIACFGIVISLAQNPAQDILTLLLSWIASALFLSGVGIYVTVRSRVLAFGVLVSGFLWLAFGLFSSFFMPGMSFGAPLNLIQPFLWIVNLHATLADFVAQDFWLNRAFLAIAGLGLMAMAIRQMGDSEQVLLNVSQKRHRQSQKPNHNPSVMTTLRSKTILTPVAIEIRPLIQIVGIVRYELKMLWRSRSLKVLTITPLAALAMFGLMYSASGDLLPGMTTTVALTSDQTMILNGELLALMGITFYFILGLYLIPIIMADRVTADVSLRADELLNSTPITDVSYLTGKVLGAMLAGMSIIIFSSALAMIGWRILIGNYVMMMFVDTILVTLIGMIFQIGIAVMLGSTQSTGRRALALVMLVLILPEFMTGLGFLPSRIAILNIYLNDILNNMLMPPPILRDIVLFNPPIIATLVQAGLQFIVVAVLVWAWKKYRTQ